MMLLLRHAQFHGARRLLEPIFRWWWMLALLCLLAGAASVLAAVLMRFFEAPTILVRLRSIRGQIQFPCVVLCPEVDFPQEKIDAFLKDLNIPPNMTRSDVGSKLDQLAAYFARDVVYEEEDLVMMEEVLHYNGLGVEAAVERLMKNCNETILKCRWLGHVVDCSTLFSMEMTGDGFCCVFNCRSLRREISENGIHEVKRSPPVYIDQIGHSSGLLLAVDQQQMPFNVDLSYKWLALQGGNRYVDLSVNGTPLSPGIEHWFGFHQSQLQLSDQARGFSDNLLRCRLETDALKYFPIYSWKYCLLECEIENTLKKCGCVRPSHIKVPEVKECRARSLHCAIHAGVSTSSSGECSCPQACEMERDYTEAQSFQLAQHGTNNDHFYDGLELSQASIVRVYMFKFQSPVFHRRPIQTNLDLFSNLGGIFNVYFGCSVLTLLELAILLLRCLRSTATRWQAGTSNTCTLNDKKRSLQQRRFMK